MLSRRTSVVSIPTADDKAGLSSSLKVLESILSTQGRAISHLASQFQVSQWSRDQYLRSISVLNDSLNSGGKIIVCGMGKSYKIAAKSVATLNSLCVHSALLHPSEALHGDLGIVREDHGDCMILISASGNSPEMLTMMQHVPDAIPVIVLTCAKKSPLSEHPQVQALLYAELPKRMSEQNLYGLAAPTISTTLCLSLMDSVSIALAELQVKDLAMRKRLFGVRHPGGAIGRDYLLSNQCDSNDVSSTVSSNSLSAGGNSEFYVVDSDTSSEVLTDAPEAETETVEQLLDLDLVAKLKDPTVSKIHVGEIPTDELELMRIVVLHDVMIVGKKLAIETNEIRDIFRSASDDDKKMQEYVSRIEQSLRNCYI
ncbi:unnamed protein product [Kuraishia capsulata CBS 1993]|uniref:SIS domain-containing protein n=1 Tax=Kuraishia capsulata CBS 1993 TaxID=1382522 RepID=W6MRC9_9ASCO|nr:uncharacterized protein KUCA_T00005284001 [Kuraishia capsulata CBS 1993]CDK29296.1 unnamed protein product [Kuraishia capsulata CBS 1993]